MPDYTCHYCNERCSMMGHAWCQKGITREEYYKDMRKKSAIKRRIDGFELEVITESDGTFMVAIKGEPGSRVVGRGKSLVKAFGNFLINRQQDLGITGINLDEGAIEAERKRRKKELAKR